METGNRQQMSLALMKFKTIEGAVDFPALFEIKTEDRLPCLYLKNPVRIAAIVTAGLTLAMEAMNLSRPMNAKQIVNLADVILEGSAEDNLSLEDLMLFLQGLIRGEYGERYESMDIPKFMQMFEVYREKRFQAMQALKEEQRKQFDALPLYPRLPNLRTIVKGE